MRASEGSPLNRLLEHALVRRVLGTLFASSARRHLARMDRVRPYRAQLRLLLGMLHRTRRTTFGRDHDFRRIRTPEDFRRLVPVRSVAELQRDYGRTGQTWPDPLPFRVSTGLKPRSFALSHELQSAQRVGFFTALSLVARERPLQSLTAGKLVWLGDDSTLAVTGPTTLTASQLGEARFPWLLRSQAIAGPGWSCPQPDAGIGNLLASQPIRCLIGSASRILNFLDRCPADDHLAAVVVSHDHGFDLAQLRDRLDPRVLLLPALANPEGWFALHDPRVGGMRLLTDHGVYFEFIPQDGSPRRWLHEVHPGTPYEIAISSPAGVWAVATGTMIEFTQVDPPLVRLLPPKIERPTPVIPAPHRQSAGKAATLPEMSVRSPWSTPADRG